MGDEPDALGATMAATPDGTRELPASDRVAPGELGPGAAIGHFVIDALLGAGGMGVVFAGHDADLGRPVAIKLVRDDVDHPAHHARLLREAQVMARLEHPNVVKVYEVGSDRGRLFVAMELVEGTTLSAWLRAQPRSTREVVAMFQQVGAGLAAVHRAGLVHRDFKPDNVLVDRAGHARVADFGLARIDADQLAAGSPALTTLTQTGMRMGTPGYMAPEQQFGANVDARADQYSYCVALREALSATKQPVPRLLRALVARGLAYDASERFASMDELLVGLGRRDRRAWLIGGAIAALAAVIVIISVAANRVYSAANRDDGVIAASHDAMAAIHDEVVAIGSDAAASKPPPAAIHSEATGSNADAGIATAPHDAAAITVASIAPHGDARARDAATDAAPDAAGEPVRHAIAEGHLAAVKAAFAELGYRGLSFEGDSTNDVKDLRDKLAALATDQLAERGKLLWALGLVQRKQGACSDALATLAASRVALGAANRANPRDHSVFAWDSLGWLAAALCDFTLDHLDATLAELGHALQESFAVTDVAHGEMLLVMGILEWETLDPVRGKATVLLAGKLGDSKLRTTLEAWARAVGLALR